MHISKIFYSLLSALTLASCSGEYQIEGTSSVLQLDGKMLFVKVLSGNQLVKLDSAEVVHGHFTMNGKIDSSMMGALYMDDQSIMPLVVEEGKIKILLENTHVLVKGTSLNDNLYRFVEQRNDLDMKAYEIERKESRMIMDGLPNELVEQQISRERNQLIGEMDSLAKCFIQQNYGNVLGPGIFLMLGNSLPYPVLTPVMQDILESAPGIFKENRSVQEYVDAAKDNMDKIKASR